MQAFKRFYVWGMNAKFYMGIYFVAIVFLTGVVTALTGGESLRLVHLLQMLIVAMGAALAQVLLLEGRHPRSAASLRVRSVLWVVGTAVATGTCAAAFDWLEQAQSYGPWLLGGCMVLGCGAMLLGLRFEQEADSCRLEQELEAYRQARKKK